jgi:AraC-like DNA-binding protein
MKAKFEYIEPSPDSSFTFREFKVPCFDVPFHFHPEYELTLILSGEGKRFVGNQIADFHPGDLVLLGADVSHCWLTDKNSSIATNKTLPRPVINAHSVVIHFREDFLGKEFFQKPEFVHIRQLLLAAKSGIRICNGAAQHIAAQLLAMRQQTAFQRLMTLLHVLRDIAQLTDTQLLSDGMENRLFSQADCNRIHKVYNYVMDNFQREVELAEVAALVHMTPTSFCRYFKKVTRKTFFQMVSEYRIRHAMRLLAETDLPVGETGFASGFGNSSHFNQQFRAVNHCTPLQYRKNIKKYVENIHI